MITEIPKGDVDTPGPCWIPQFWDGLPRRPAIKCQCGMVTHIGLHHVHPDGVVMASYHHATAETFVEGGHTYSHTPGCGWHVWIKLLDYDQGEFPPVP